MPSARKIIYGILSVLAFILMVLSVLSIFRNTPSNFMKMLDFARLQFFILSLVVLPAFLLLTKRWRWYNYALTLGLLGGLVINGFYLVHYTPLYPEQVPSANSSHAADDQVSIYLANVLMKNRAFEAVQQQIESKEADLVLLMEVDNWWIEKLTPVLEKYPHREVQPNDVTYGMALYSKFPLSDIEINEINNEDVPSFEATVRLKNGRQVRLQTVHPVPPREFKRLPDNEGQREYAMLNIGKKVKESKLPNIVMGDFNDVVWGFTDLLTGTENLLDDVRVGRGIYSTFNAKNWLMRWPLDHVLVTKEFQLNTLQRMGDIGSDHFPVYVELVLPD